MIKIFNAIRDFIIGMDKKEFIRSSAIYIGLNIIFLGLIIVRHLYFISDEQERMQQLNQTRKAVQKILTQFNEVEEQRKKVSVLLKDKFYIQKFFEDHTKKFKIHSSEKLSRQKMENGYIEETLTIALTQITTKQLCDLLQDIESEQRVYIKFIDISKTGGSRKINVSMAIATLIPTAE